MSNLFSIHFVEAQAFMYLSPALAAAMMLIAWPVASSAVRAPFIMSLSPYTADIPLARHTQNNMILQHDVARIPDCKRSF